MPVPEVEEKDLTPLMRQYLSIKKQHPDKILLYRMGDFYELFFEDAELASRELDITLTARDKGPYGGKIPLAGVPYHALDNYLPKLVKKGYKVAIAEQVEDPKRSKGIVKREVIQVVTPGTLLLQDGSEETSNKYLSAVTWSVSGDNEVDLQLSDIKGTTQDRIILPKASYGVSHLDITTGDFFTTEIRGKEPFQRLVSELMKFQAKEIVLPDSIASREDLPSELKLLLGEGIAISSFPDHNFLSSYSEAALKSQFNVLSLEGLGLTDLPLARDAAGAVLAYARENQMTELGHIKDIKVYSGSEFMVLDSTTLRNLEVLRSLRDNSTRGTLLGILDRTRTPMGSRAMKNWIQQPLMDVGLIKNRQDAVEALFDDLFLRSDIKDLLKTISDIERSLMRSGLGRGSARDLNSIKDSLISAEELGKVLSSSDSILRSSILEKIAHGLGGSDDVIELISSSIKNEPPLSTKDGGMIKDGYSKELDEISAAAADSKEWLKGFEKSEKKRTGIRSLKVKFNNVFGYYIDVTKANLSMVPDHYIRKQTLVNSERFITPELKEKESIILNSEERMAELEARLFEEIKDRVLEKGPAIQEIAKNIASLDVLLTLAEVASKRNYTRPEVDNERRMDLKRSRHPVIEDKVEWGFVPNDIYLDGEDNRFVILTGPNMAGKSTYMRQAALIVIMAQMGSFIPASSGKIGVVDRVFTRVGASDDLVRGQSTFMVEMLELANILNSATDRSLVLLDEIGRGTSTFDGLSIAWAVTEYISDKDKVGANTIFASHYHHLTELEGKLQGVVNYSMSVKEQEGGITFLRKVRKGPASRSYGVEVAGLAGIPEEVVERAREVLGRIEKEDQIEGRAAEITSGEEPEPAVFQRRGKGHTQMVLFPTEEMLAPGEEGPVMDELRSLDPNNLTPMQALEILYKLKRRLEK